MYIYMNNLLSTEVTYRNVFRLISQKSSLSQVSVIGNSLQIILTCFANS